MIASNITSVCWFSGNVTSENKSYNPLFDNPVFSPLARAGHFRQSSPGTHVIYDGDAIPAQSFSWSGLSEAQWWVSENQDPPAEADQLPGSYNQALPGRPEYPDLLPRLLSRDLDTQSAAKNFIAVGVADLLNVLREKDLKRQSEPDVSKANPFDEALKNASSEVALDKGKKDAGSQPAKQDQKSVDNEAGGGGSPDQAYRNLLFVGSFNDQPVATAVAVAQPGLLHSSTSNSVVFDLAGIGERSFDMDIVLRNQDNQESVAFGDLNNDGFPDMVVTNKTTNKANVYLNDGQGNYTYSADIYGGLGPVAATISDFSGDGRTDIAVALQTDKRIVVDGKGLRKFIFLPTSTINEDCSSMLPYDFDGDGLPDLLLTDYQNLISTIYLNQGKATFAASDSFSLQSFPYLQSRVDLDGDGTDDLVYIQYLGDHVSIVMVNGQDGSVTSLGNIVMSDPSLYYVVGDFNLDGVVDVAIARRR